MCDFNEKDYIFNVDWLTIRVNADIDTFILDFCETFNLDFYKDIAVRKNGLYLYPYGYYVSELGSNVISFSYNKDENGKSIVSKYDITGNVANYGVLCNITGDGCRWLQSRSPVGFSEFLDICLKYEYNVTRFDVCCDIFDKDNPIIPLVQRFGLEFYDMEKEDKIGMANGFSRKDFVKVHYVWDGLLSHYTPNITIGNRSSTKGQMQVYNKRVEIEEGRLSSIKDAFFSTYEVKDYWYRIEYRCKSFANYVFDNFVSSDFNPGVAFLAAAIRFGRFTLPVHSVEGNLKTVPEWQYFVEWLDTIHLV